MRRNRIWYGAACIAALITWIIANKRGILIFLWMMLLIPVLLAVMEATAVRQITLTASIKGSCRVEQENHLNLKLKNNSPFPIGSVQAKVIVNNRLYQQKEEKILILQPTEKHSMSFLLQASPQECGSIRISVPEIYCCDLFGLFRFCKKVDLELETLSYPPKFQSNLQLHRRPQTKNTGEIYDQYRKGYDVSEMFGLRDYAEGDTPGSIHWKLSGKLDKLVVREFAYPSSYSTLILYDMMKNADGVDISNRRNDAVVAFTDALSLRLLEWNYEHHAARVVNGDYQDVPVYSRATHDNMVMNLLCRAIPEKVHTVDTLYYFLRGNLAGRYTKMIYITPEYDENSVRQLAKEIDLTIIHILEDKQFAYTEEKNYSVIPVNAATNCEQIQNIVI